MDKNKILELFAANELQAADMLLSSHSDDAWALYMRGRIAWKESRRGDAISFYSASVLIEPCGEASVALEQARAIMEFFHQDLYNP